VLAKLLSLGGALYSLAAFLYVTFSRLGYPFALEWLEGTSLVHVQRILSGKLLYVQPTLSFIPLSYPPVYYYVSAWFARLMGDGFLPLRLVSLLSTLGSFGLIYVLTRRSARSPLSACVAVGLFAAMFSVGGAWFDIARVDMLAVFLMLASLYMALQDRWWWSAAAGLTLALACLTKQTLMIVLAGMCLHALFTWSRSNAFAFAGTALAGFAGAVLLLDRLHAGWFRFFVFELPGRHDLLRELTFASRELWIGKLMLALPIASMLAIAYCVLTARTSRARGLRAFVGSDAGRLLTVLFTTLVLGWSGLANPGGYNNVLVPLLAILALTAGLGFDQLATLRTGAAMQLALGAALLLQFGLLRYPVAAQIPTAADLAAGNALVDMLRDQPGGVFVPYHPELALLAGKPALANYIAMYELEGGQGGGDETSWRQVRVELVASFQKHKVDLILLDKNQFWGSPERYYSATEVAIQNDAFYPVTGWRIRPLIAYAFGR
jgi:4-amino-4-deoxy-L-arabinose transferase-like glycosyltransferase